MDFIRKTFRFARDVISSFLGNHCAMHAAGLTYYSMLSLVPLLCIILIGARMLGAGDYARDKTQSWIEERIQEMESAPDDPAIAPLAVAQSEEAIEQKRNAARLFASQARDVVTKIFDTIDRVDLGSLGWIGFIMLIWTVLSSIGMIEVSFDEIWEVEKGRAFLRRQGVNALVMTLLPVFVSLALSGPVLKIAKDVIVATAGAVSITRWLSDGMVWLLDCWLIRTAISLFFSSLAFAFLFSVLPNASTNRKAAWKCGLATAILFGAWLKICAVAQVGIAKSSALYGSLAFVPIMLAWIYMSWQIVLFGCCMHKVASGGKAK